MNRRLITRLVLAAVVVFAVADAAHALSIGVNSRRSSNGATLMPASDVAGVVPQANWNNGPQASSGTEAGIVGPTPGVLVDDLGNATGMTMQFSAPGAWSVGTGGSGGAADKRMMTGYLDMSGDGAGQIITIDLANIPYAEYDVFLYHSSATGANRTMRVTANDGVVASTLYTRNLAPADQFNGFILDQHVTLADSNASLAGGNYVQFLGLTGSTLHLETQGLGAADGGHPGGGNTRRGPIQGIQIVLVPEPATLSLLAFGGISLLLRRRRRR